ncbi:MAG: hypothetical protein ACE5O2_12175, partial [Armatimonadota bacterium]
MMRAIMVLIYATTFVCVACAARGDVYLFDMGTDESALREGFARVTKGGAFSEQAGYGWAAVEGIAASRKAWTEPVEN